MNTEINFLEKERKRMKTPLFLFLIFAVLIIVAAAVLWWMHSGLSSAIDTEKKNMTALEDRVAELEASFNDAEQLEQTREALSSIKAETTPRRALFQRVHNLLRNAGNLTSFTYNDAGQFQLDASFDTLTAVSDYISQLLQQPYLLDATISGVSKAGDAYNASLVVTVDSDVLREEMSADAD